MSQKTPESAKKNINNMNSLLARLNRKPLTTVKIERMLTVDGLTMEMLSRRAAAVVSGYFCSGVLAMSLYTDPLSTVTTTSRAIFTSTVFFSRLMLFTVP